MEIKKFILNEFKKQKFDDVIIIKISNESKQIKFSKNKIVNTEVNSDDEISLFLTKDKKILQTNLRNASKEKIANLARRSLVFLKNLPENKDYFGIAKGPFKYKKLKNLYDKKILNLNDTDILQKAINSSLKEGAIRTDGTYTVSLGNLELITSNGVDTKEKVSNLHLSMRSFLNKESSGHSDVLSRNLKEFNVEYVGKHSGEIAKLALNPKDGKKGKYDVIFDPLPISSLIAQIGDACSIFSVESGLSFLQNKLKKNVANKIFTLIDDPYYPNGVGSTPFDLEGVPTRKNILIKDGILQTYLHNTSTAKKYKTKTTANAGLLNPQPWNLVVKPGKISHNSLFKDIKKGIYVTNLWYTRFTNYLIGEFSTIPRDGIFYIENGEIKYPIKNIRISDKMPDLLKNIKKIANNTIQTKNWESESGMHAITPSILVRDINITKPRQ